MAHQMDLERQRETRTLVEQPGTGYKEYDSDNVELGPPGDGHHVRRLYVQLGLLFFVGCIVQLVLRFVLAYVGHYSVSISVSAPSAIFGVFSLVGYLTRTYSLGRRNSTTRPLGGSRWSFDFFHINFTFGIIFVTALVSAANALKPPKMQIAAMPLSVLLLQVGIQLLLVQIAAAAKVRYFCRISSMAKNSEVLRPALYTIIEDLVAVEGKQGTAWRAAFNRRYQRSPGLRRLLASLSWMWGILSTFVGIVGLCVIYKIENLDVGWIVGWSVPWVFAAIMAVPTYFMAKSMLD